MVTYLRDRCPGRFVSSFALFLFLGVSCPTLADTDVFWPTNIYPTRSFSTLDAAETAMRAVNANAALLQFDSILGISGVWIYRTYKVPPVSPIPPVWTDYGLCYELGTSGQAACDAQRVIKKWPNPLTYIPDPPNPNILEQGKCRDLTRSDQPILGNPGRWMTCPGAYTLSNTTYFFLCGQATFGWGPNATCVNSTTARIDVEAKCPIDVLTRVEDIPPNGPDVLPLTLKLEETRGKVNLLTTDTQVALSCLITKAAALRNAAGVGVTVEVTSFTRTVAYQQHFIEIWDKMNAHDRLKDESPPHYKACEARRNKVIAEKGNSARGDYPVGDCLYNSHCIRYMPVPDSKHIDGLAFDISQQNITDIENNLALRQLPLAKTIPDLLAETSDGSPACKLKWVGNSDRVHFNYTP